MLEWATLAAIKRAVQLEIQDANWPPKLNLRPRVVPLEDAVSVVGMARNWCGGHGLVACVAEWDEIDPESYVGGRLCLIVESKKGVPILFAASHFGMLPKTHYALEAFVHSPDATEAERALAVDVQGIPALRALLRLGYTTLVVPTLRPTLTEIADANEPAIPLERSTLGTSPEGEEQGLAMPLAPTLKAMLIRLAI